MATQVEAVEKLGGQVVQVSASYDRKISDGNYGSIGGFFSMTVDLSEGADADKVADALYALVKSTAERNLKPSFEAISKPRPIAQAPDPEPKQVQRQAPPVSDGGLSFVPETLTATVSEGKVYWKVKGGKFSQYGVTIWPEALEASGLTDLDPMQVYNLQQRGFKSAIYVENDKGKPSKVTALV